MFALSIVAICFLVVIISITVESNSIVKMHMQGGICRNYLNVFPIANVGFIRLNDLHDSVLDGM